MNNKLESVLCPTCHHNNHTLQFLREDGIGFYICKECNIEYASPRLKEEELLNLYNSDSWKNPSEYLNWSYEKWNKSRGLHYYLVAENLKLVKRFLEPGSRILDVGCDIGLTVKKLIEDHYHAEGIEISSIGSKIAKEKTKITVHNLEIKDFKSNKLFDGVLLLDVLEHLYDPLNTLKSCAKKLRKGGYIFIHVPQHKGLSVRFKKILHKIGIKKSYKHFGFPAHIYNFDKKSLRLILNKSNFKIEHFESWPNQVTNGKVNWLNFLPVWLIKKLSLSDYIICVAKRK